VAKLISPTKKVAKLISPTKSRAKSGKTYITTYNGNF
jgi:hypothetical protein